MRRDPLRQVWERLVDGLNHGHLSFCEVNVNRYWRLVAPVYGLSEHVHFPEGTLTGVRRAGGRRIQRIRRIPQHVVVPGAFSPASRAYVIARRNPAIRYDN